MNNAFHPNTVSDFRDLTVEQILQRKPKSFQDIFFCIKPVVIKDKEKYKSSTWYNLFLHVKEPLKNKYQYNVANWTRISITFGNVTESYTNIFVEGKGKLTYY